MSGGGPRSRRRITQCGGSHLLTRNQDLAETSRTEHVAVWGWSIPALAARLDDGRIVKTCPAAGICAHACYARRGRYRFRNVSSRHQANLTRLLDDPVGWQRDMTDEIARKRRPCAIRIHDAGDFFTDDYLDAWCDIAAAAPDVTYYAYTKEISRYRRIRARRGSWPPNFVIRLSYGGREDHLIDPAVDPASPGRRRVPRHRRRRRRPRLGRQQPVRPDGREQRPADVGHPRQPTPRRPHPRRGTPVLPMAGRRRPPQALDPPSLQPARRPRPGGLTCHHPAARHPAATDNEATHSDATRMLLLSRRGIDDPRQSLRGRDRVVADQSICAGLAHQGTDLVDVPDVLTARVDRGDHGGLAALLGLVNRADQSEYQGADVVACARVDYHCLLGLVTVSPANSQGLIIKEDLRDAVCADQIRLIFHA